MKELHLAEILNKSLDKVFLEVLEQHSFLITDPINADQASAMEAHIFEKYICIEMGLKVSESRISQDLEGVFIFLLPETVSQEIEENLTGKSLGSSQSGELSADGAQEILNIVGANVVSEAFGNDVNFSISVPKARYFNVKEWQQYREIEFKAALMLDEKPLFLFLDLKQLPQ